MTDRPAPFIGALRVPWLRPLAQGLRAFALLVGIVAAVSNGWTVQDTVAVVGLALFLAWRATPAPASPARLRDVMLVELVVTLGAVALTDGWSSPWLLPAIVTLGLASLGLVVRRAAILGLSALLVVSVATIGSWPAPDEVLTRATTLLIVVGFGVVSRLILLQVGGEQDEALGELDTLWSVRALLEGLHTRAAGTRARFSIEEALLALRSSSPVLAAAEVLAVLAVEEDGTLRVLDAVGLPEREFLVRDLPSRIGQPRRDGEPLAAELPSGGLSRDARHGVYTWLPVGTDHPEHVLVAEYGQDVLPDAALPEFTRIAQPLALTVGNAVWFQRVRHLGVDEERQRIAAHLHDQFAQSLAALQLELELATKRHPDDTELETLRRRVKATLGELRDTMVDLRAVVDDERDLPRLLQELVDRLGDRHGVVSELVCEGDGERPSPAVEQQLLRMTQELTRRAVEERGAIAVYVRYRLGRDGLELTITDDGDAPTDEPRRSASQAVRDRAEAIGARVETGPAGQGLSAVSVVLGTGAGERV